jgi:hypothetical protein
MNDAAASQATLDSDEARWRRLPPWLRPRAVELKGSGNLWLIETTLLVLVGLVLAIATINDVARQTGINHRLIADLKTWRHYTRHDYHNISIDQETLGITSQREVLCGNTSPGAPKSRTQICLTIWGPMVNGVRVVHGGWYLPANVENDLPSERYGCFGVGGQGRCAR